MGKTYPENIDPRPKRRKDKDNPYEIFTVGADTKHPKYYVRFTDGTDTVHCIEIEQTVFEEMDSFELDDLSHLNKVDRHFDKQSSTPPDGHLNESLSMEETVLMSLQNEALHTAISMLPEKQQRRIRLYYFEQMTYSEIGQMENCSKQSVQESIKDAEKKLKKFLKNFSV